MNVAIHGDARGIFGSSSPAIHGRAFAKAARQCHAQPALAHPAGAGCAGRGQEFSWFAGHPIQTTTISGAKP